MDNDADWRFQIGFLVKADNCKSPRLCIIVLTCSYLILRLSVDSANPEMPCNMVLQLQILMASESLSTAKLITSRSLVAGTSMLECQWLECWIAVQDS